MTPLSAENVAGNYSQRLTKAPSRSRKMSFSFLIDKPIDGPQYQTYTHSLDVAHRSAAQTQCANDSGKVAFDQGHSRAFHRDISTSAHRDSDIASTGTIGLYSAFATQSEFWPE